MGDITIQSVVVKAKTAAIKRNIQSDILNDNKKEVKRLKQYMKDSKGKTVIALKKQLDKEEQLINGIGDVLMDLVEYMNTVCDEFDQLDQKYASRKIQ